MLRRRSKSLLIAGLAGAVLILVSATPVIAGGNAATPASVVSASQASFQLRSPAVPPLATWVPWDGFYITTLEKCLARKQYISQTYQIPLSALRCVEEGLPPVRTGSSKWTQTTLLRRALRIEQELTRSLLHVVRKRVRPGTLGE